MAKDISVLNPEQFQEVRNALLELVKTLNARKAPGSSNMIPDEDIVLTSIQHPERGDVLITVIPDRTGLQIFVSNRRDPDNPFAIMSHGELRDFPGRRPLNHSVSTLKEGQRGLFLITVQDRELLRAHQLDAIQGYSSRFNVAEKRDDGPAKEDITLKPLSECTPEQKLEIYRKKAPGDQRVQQIEKEFFGVEFQYSRHKRPAATEVIFLGPEAYREKINQLIRDVYPYGVRVSLRRDYPAEHKEKLAEVHRYLRELAGKLRQRINDNNPPEINKHYNRVCDYLEDIVENDAELTRVV